ncbi:MAG: hypothetical protein CSA81_10285 [Acidobacteria bacterium]|nr:MAG: hypothetical protein CSA81_10285 [Acidobacteriota bacterium]
MPRQSRFHPLCGEEDSKKEPFVELRARESRSSFTCCLGTFWLIQPVQDQTEAHPTLFYAKIQPSLKAM